MVGIQRRLAELNILRMECDDYNFKKNLLTASLVADYICIDDRARLRFRDVYFNILDTKGPVASQHEINTTRLAYEINARIPYEVAARALTGQNHPTQAEEKPFG